MGFEQVLSSAGTAFLLFSAEESQHCIRGKLLKMALIAQIGQKGDAKFWGMAVGRNVLAVLQA